jgi:hypothetical protein
MAIHPDLLHALEDIDAATNDVAQEVDDLRSAVSVGMSAEDVEAVHARMHAQAEKLRGIAKDPEAPVPPVDPPVVDGE